MGKAITMRSFDPDDPNVVRATVIDRNGAGRAVTFNHGEKYDSILSGITLKNGSASEGGAIYCSNSSPTIIKCNISQNYANSKGGGVYCYYLGSPEFINCNISDNNSGTYGGGIYCVAKSSPKFTNCTITNNSSASYGSAIFSTGESIPKFNFCTIAGNSGGTGAIGLIGNYDYAPRIDNCIIWNNSTPEIYKVSSVSPTITYSDIKGDYSGTGNIDSDPLFVAPALKNYHLQAESNCIEASDPGAEEPEFDKDGNLRALLGAIYDMILVHMSL